MSQAGPRGPANVNKPPPAPVPKAAATAAAPAKPAAPAASPPTKAAAPAASPPAKAAVPPASLSTKAVAPAAASPPAPPVAPREGVRPRLGTSPGIGVGGDTPRSPVVESSDEVQALVRTAIAEAVGAVLAETGRLIRKLEQRVEQLEQLDRRPAASTAVVHAAPPAGSSAWAQSSYATSTTVQRAVVEAQAPLLDIGTIERSVQVDVDPALDGKRRRRRLVVFVTLFFLVVFGGLFALLANSYTPHP